MENASKALLIAAGALIGVMILSLGIYLYITFGQQAREVYQKNINQEIVAFNTQFSVYEGRKDLTIYDIRTSVSYAQSNNRQYYNDQQHINYIKVFLDGIQIQDKDLAFFNGKMIDDTSQIQNAVIGNEVVMQRILYKCESLGYNSEGRVNEIKFRKVGLG